MQPHASRSASQCQRLRVLIGDGGRCLVHGEGRGQLGDGHLRGPQLGVVHGEQHKAQAVEERHGRPDAQHAPRAHDVQHASDAHGARHHAHLCQVHLFTHPNEDSLDRVQEAGEQQHERDHGEHGPHRGRHRGAGGEGVRHARRGQQQQRAHHRPGGRRVPLDAVRVCPHLPRLAGGAGAADEDVRHRSERLRHKCHHPKHLGEDLMGRALHYPLPRGERRRQHPHHHHRHVAHHEGGRVQ
mmetsp:Transcript_23707/g.51773  ORF Transcript_23707/g.51773 Transcript_23707/m.51773 type:complete len:241 (+) Transcript_23707:640-1362(+)